MTNRDRTLLNLLEHAVFVLEPDAAGLPRYTACNRFALDGLGKTEAEVIGKTAQDLFSGRLGAIEFNHQVQGLQSGQEQTYEIQLPLAKGQRSLRMTLRPEKDAQGCVVRLIGSATDVSEHQMIAKMRMDFETINSEMGDFINLAAHDLRVPMRHVSVIADLLRDEFEDLGDGKLNLINMLEDVGSKAMTLIGDVLAHAQSMNLITECVEFEFPALMDDIMALLDPMGRVSVTVPDVRLVGDQMATQVVLRNLIDNAIKHAGACETGVSGLQISLQVSAGPACYEIRVHDNGKGFSEPARVFLNGGKLRTDSGFGMLGVRRLIHARGGTLAATNGPDGTGGLVSFTLPGRLQDGVDTRRSA